MACQRAPARVFSCNFRPQASSHSRPTKIRLTSSVGWFAQGQSPSGPPRIILSWVRAHIYRSLNCSRLATLCKSHASEQVQLKYYIRYSSGRMKRLFLHTVASLGCGMSYWCHPHPLPIGCMTYNLSGVNPILETICWLAEPWPSPITP